MFKPLYLEQVDELHTRHPEINPRALRAYLEQFWFAEKILESGLPIESYLGKNILEVGPAESGLLKYFSERGAHTFGLELSARRFAHSRELNPGSDMQLHSGDICKWQDIEPLNLPPMDAIVLRDVIEHIPDKEKAMTNLFRLLRNQGVLFITFPPKWAPFSGHQQTSGRMAAKIPYIYLLPDSLYKIILRVLGVNENKRNYLLRTKSTRLGIREFIHLAEKSGFKILRLVQYFVRPEYRFRFGLPSMQNRLYVMPIIGSLFSNGISTLLVKP